ncbi:MAG TPA: DHA2 family efflux MFS transporter permease subunit [Solirubrobacterales bacterium]|nr:DHA2 family efflux MFS transporter permease subunit [Solirubrobacterales bacterium]
MPRDSKQAEGIAYGTGPGRWVLAIAVLGSGIVFLDGTVVNVALPRIGEDFGAETSSLQWILNGYMLTLASLILLGGSLGDRYGRRRMFVVGLAWFTISSLLCAVAPSADALVGARLLQGVGGALLTPGSLAMIESSFRPADRARAIGAWSGLGGVATALGPLLGGWLVEAVTWRAIFLINVPIGVFVAVMATRHVPETSNPDAPDRLDGLGALLAAVGLGGTTYALIQGPDQGWSASIVIAALAGILGLIAFIFQERRSPHPMMPLNLFRSRQFSAANAVTFVVYAALSGVFFLLVAFLQIAAGYSPIAAGAASLPVTVLMLLFSARSGAFAQRFGARIPLTIGPLVIALGMLMMTRIDADADYLTSVLPAVIVFGIGLTFVVAPVTATVLAAAESRHSGIASGINNAVSRVGGLLAVAVLPLIAGLTGDAFYDPAAMTDGFHTAMYVTAALSALGGLIAWATIESDVLGAEEPAEPITGEYSCDFNGPPVLPTHHEEAPAVGPRLASGGPTPPASSP